jgi:hypothetical protein
VTATAPGRGGPGVPGADPEPFCTTGSALHPVRDDDEVAGHDDGFANATLWRLYHDVVVVLCSSTVDRIVARPIHAA